MKKILFVAAAVAATLALAAPASADSADKCQVHTKVSDGFPFRLIGDGVNCFGVAVDSRPDQSVQYANNNLSNVDGSSLGHTLRSMGKGDANK